MTAPAERVLDDTAEGSPAGWDVADSSPILAFAGDWHGHIEGVQAKLQLLAELGVTRLLHVGDFAIWPDRSGRRFLDQLNDYAIATDIRIAVTPGNHEDWRYLLDCFESAGAGKPAPIRSHISALPRGFSWTQRGRSLLSFGGAASIDYEWRVPGFSWWPEELPTDADLARLRGSAPVDIMITHDSPIPGVPKVQAIRESPGSWSEEALDYAYRGARIITEAWQAAAPQILIHGHFHVRDTLRFTSGQRIVSLAKENDRGNVLLIDLADLNTMWLDGFN
ncbi:MAG: metallophosphoesterase [Kineosporiaceae bacterium]|nr:metallophosphoesterase [Aeromicrobium sp.]